VAPTRELALWSTYKDGERGVCQSSKLELFLERDELEISGESEQRLERGLP